MTQAKGKVSEAALWRKLNGLPRAGGRRVVEQALTLWCVLVDRDTPLWLRAAAIAALGYFLTVWDAVPDVITGVGYADDLAVMAMVLAQAGRFVTPAIREKVQRLLPGALRDSPKRQPKGRRKIKRKGKRHAKTETNGGDGGES